MNTQDSKRQETDLNKDENKIQFYKLQLGKIINLPLNCNHKYAFLFVCCVQC